MNKYLTLDQFFFNLPLGAEQNKPLLVNFSTMWFANVTFSFSKMKKFAEFVYSVFSLRNNRYVNRSLSFNEIPKFFVSSLLWVSKNQLGKREYEYASNILFT